MGKSPYTNNCIVASMTVVAHSFHRCKGKSQLPNGLGIQYGFRKIFLPLLERVFDVIRTKASDCLSSSAARLCRLPKQEPLCGIVKREISKKPVTDNNVPDAPTDTPKEKKDDLPF